MPVYHIFSIPVQVEYKAQLFSKATLFHCLCVAANVLFAALLVYRSDGLWIKTNTYSEQPDVNFKHDMLLIMQLRKPIAGTKLVWSTFNDLNYALDGNRLRIPRIANYELDSNGDGKYDELNLQVSMPLKQEELVTEVQLLLFFDYKLHDKVTLQMESLAHFNYRSAVPGSRLSVVGELRFSQKEPLVDRGRDFRFNRSVLNQHEFNDFSVEKILTEYLRQNLSTVIGENSHYIWETGRDVTQDEFQVHFTLIYPTELILYKPGFWFLVKWAWIQYLAVFLVLYFIIRYLKVTVFQNQIVNTTVHCSKGSPPIMR